MIGRAPLSDRILRAVAYLFTALVGWYTLAVPPSSVTDALGHVMAVVWALMMTAGLPAAWFTLAHKFRGEYAALVPMLAALAVAILATWLKVSGEPDLIPRVSVATALACLFVVRLMVLHRLTMAKPVE